MEEELSSKSRAGLLLLVVGRWLMSHWYLVGSGNHIQIGGINQTGVTHQTDVGGVCSWSEAHGLASF